MTEFFSKTTITAPNCRPTQAYSIQCRKCGAVEKLAIPNHGKDPSPENVAAKFRNKGWSVAARRGHDVCPSCQSRNKAKLRVVSESEETQPFHAEPPREMSREDRRVIFAKLNDVYLDEDQGYDAGWSDAKVADDLGVPRAWITAIREENFGAEIIIGDGAKALIAEFNDLLKEQARFAKDYDKNQDRLLKLAAEEDARRGKFEDSLKAEREAVLSAWKKSDRELEDALHQNNKKMDDLAARIAPLLKVFEGRK